jgi:hypothetical protein
VRRKNKVALAILISIGVLGIFVYGYYLALGRNSMVLDILQAKEYLRGAQSSKDLNEMADYLNNATTAISKRTGNPNWLFHQSDTDFELIKFDLQRNVDAARHISKTLCSETHVYQSQVNTIEDLCTVLKAHLDGAVAWLTDWSPTTLLFNAVAWTIFAVVGIYQIALAGSKLEFMRKDHGER